MSPFLLSAPHSLREMSPSLGEPLSSVGKLRGGWEGENKQWPSGFSRLRSQEASLAPSLIWPGRSGLGACAGSTTLPASEGWGPLLVTWASGAAGARAGLRVEGGAQDVSPQSLV